MKPTQAAIARALGLSQAAVSKLKAQGMPVESIEGAHAWRLRNLDPARIKRAAPPITDPAAAIRRVHDLAQLTAAALKLGQFEVIGPQLREALRAVPVPQRDRILIGQGDLAPADLASEPGACVIPGDVWAALVHHVVSVIADDRRTRMAAGEADPKCCEMTDEEAEEMAHFWMAVAAGELLARPG